MVDGHTGFPATPAPPGTHSVRTHSPTTVGQYLGGSQPHGGLVVVGRGVVVSGLGVVVVLSGNNAPTDASLQALQAGPATHVVS